MILLDFLSCNQLNNAYRITYHRPVKNADVGLIERSFFAYLSTSKHGSAICYDSLNYISLEIKSSCFFECIGEKTGGAIYFISKSLNIKKASFDLCFCKDQNDNHFGNVIYSNSENIFYQMSSLWATRFPNR